MEHLRTDPNALAMLLDGEFTHTLLATTTVMADVETQADVSPEAPAAAHIISAQNIRMIGRIGPGRTASLGFS